MSLSLYIDICIYAYAYIYICTHTYIHIYTSTIGATFSAQNSAPLRFGPQSARALAAGTNSEKALSIVALHSKCTEALTFENVLCSTYHECAIFNRSKFVWSAAGDGKAPEHIL